MAKERAGALIALYELSATAGVLMAYTMYMLLAERPHAWRQLFYCGLIFPTLQSLAILLMPESPKWLHAQGRRQEARSALFRIYEGDVMAVERDLQVRALL